LFEHNQRLEKPVVDKVRVDNGVRRHGRGWREK
jgi:hypothetical protein